MQENYDHAVRGVKSSISVVDQRSFIGKYIYKFCGHLNNNNN